jgi:hypothetical protein
VERAKVDGGQKCRQKYRLLPLRVPTVNNLKKEASVGLSLSARFERHRQSAKGLRALH